MVTPRSVEVSRHLAFVFYNRARTTKGKPETRIVQRAIMDAVKALPGWSETDGQYGFIGDEKYPSFNESLQEAQVLLIEALKPGTPVEVSAAAKGHMKAIKAHVDAYMAEKAFVELGKPERRWLWALYEKEYGTEIVPEAEEAIETAAKALGKMGTLEDLRADAMAAAAKEEEGDEEEEKADAGSEPDSKVSPQLVP